MVVFSIMLFVLSFFIGRSMEETKISEEKKKKQEQQIKEEGQFSYSNQEAEKGPKNESTSKKPEHQHEHLLESDLPDLSNLEVLKEQEKEKAITLKDLFPQKDLDESNKVAEAFIQAYYSFNGDSPMENIEKAKIHMSKALYDSYKGQQVRPTQTIYKKEITSLEVYEPYSPTNQYITWNVRVTGKVFNSKGELSYEETYDYALKLIKEDAGYKVDKMALNVAH
jgi:hypothetical protein